MKIRSRLQQAGGEHPRGLKVRVLLSPIEVRYNKRERLEGGKECGNSCYTKMVFQNIVGKRFQKCKKSKSPKAGAIGNLI